MEEKKHEFDIIHDLLNSPPCRNLPTCTDQKGNTCLHWFVLYYNKSWVDWLSSHHFENTSLLVNVMNNQLETPFSLAIEKGYTDLAMYFLESGADPNTLSNRCRYSVLQMACYQGNVALVQALLKRGAQVYKDFNHWLFTSLQVVLWHDSPRIQKIFSKVQRIEDAQFTDYERILALLIHGHVGMV